MGNTVYDGRIKHVHDKDLYFWDTGSPSISSTVSSLSDIIDLGDAQVFANIPVSVWIEASGNFSTVSQVSTGGDYGAVDTAKGFELQDAADGSTFSTIAILVAPKAALVVNAAKLNASSIGVVTCRRYLRMRWGLGIGGAVTLKAWLRMGLTE
jgi:hypothetical protein